MTASLAAQPRRDQAVSFAATAAIV